MQTQAEYDAMSDREVLERESRLEFDTDGITWTPERIAESEDFTEQETAEWGAIEDPAAEAAIVSIGGAVVRKARPA